MATKKTKRTAGKNRAPEAGMSRPKGKKCGIAWKKVLIFVLGAVVGAGVCCAFCCKGCPKKFWGRGREMKFVNGCLDLSAIKDPAKLEMVKMRYGNKPCITEEDVKAGAPQPQIRRMRKPRPAVTE